jgi:hypothetical protein
MTAFAPEFSVNGIRIHLVVNIINPPCSILVISPHARVSVANQAVFLIGCGSGLGVAD